MIKVSVIVPVYNREKTLRRCIDSILSQTFTEFEVLLIDDGSSDNSPEICKDFAEKDDRVCFVPLKQNGGVSAARNKGIKLSKGDYILFCDSDDYVTPNWIDVLYRTAKNNPGSFVIGNYYRHLIDNNVVGSDLPDCNEVIYFDKLDYYYLYKSRLAFFIWCKIYNKKMLEKFDIAFDECVSLGEDELFNINYYIHCANSVYINEKLYYYVQHSGETLSTVSYYRFYDALKTLFYPRLSVISEKDKNEFYDDMFHRFYCSLERIFDKSNKMTEKEKKEYCRYILNDNTFIDVTNHASDKQCSRKLRFLLKTKNYFLLKLMIKLF